MKIIIEDHVVPQLMSSALEAYDIKHKGAKGGKAQDRIETIGLLWGYTLPQRNDEEKRVVATMATVETSALRTQDSATPEYESLALKKQLIERYWPQWELVGSFHSHPYDSPTEVNSNKGWRLSTEAEVEHGYGSDESFFPWLHEEFMKELDESAHLIVTVAAIQKQGWALPDHLKGKERNSGYVLNHGDRKLWLRGYGLERMHEDEELELIEYPKLEIPALLSRFNL